MPQNNFKSEIIKYFTFWFAFFFVKSREVIHGLKSYIIELCFFALLAMPRKTNSHSSSTKIWCIIQLENPRSKIRIFHLNKYFHKVHTYGIAIIAVVYLINICASHILNIQFCSPPSSSAFCF